MGPNHSRALRIAGFSTLMLAASCAGAKRPEALPFDLPAQPLATSLHVIAATAHVTIAAPATLLDGRTAPALSGQMTADEAVRRLLEGSGLHAKDAGDAIVVQPDTTDGAGGAFDDEVIVTGSRIRGAAVASTTIRRTQTDILNQGRSDLGQVVRDIPQSYGGGQNPGVGQAVPQASGINIGAGSSINLRGLGSDATLTLLDGHRLPYSAVLQSVDVSTIPIQILDRIEIVPDGASALYGSDAVAGVANIILKRDYRGIELSSVLGKATDGGDFTQQYGVLAGTTWSAGGVVAAYEYGHASEVSADQRAYGLGRPNLTLYPPIERHSVVVTAHQVLGGAFTASIDGFYNVRWSGSFFPDALGDDPTGTLTHFTSTDRSFSVAPSLTYQPGRNWRLELNGSVGREKVVFGQNECAEGNCFSDGTGTYRNTEKGVELDSDGTLARLPGGSLKLALGTGFRRIGFTRTDSTTTTLYTHHDQDSYYAFGELNVPVVGASNRSRLLYNLTATAALRYERYPGIGQVVTPKLGLIYGITADLDLRGTWGQSYRAPTLYQQWQPRSIYLFPPAFAGGAGFPVTATTMIVLGGNPGLKPERADTWSAGADLHPHGIPGLDIGAAYFSVHYRDRIVTPIQSLSVALTDSNAAGQITRDPTQAQLDAVLASGRFTNFSGQAYVPANVVAIVDNASVNAGRYIARGIDLSANYKSELPVGALAVSSDISYLLSRRQLTAAQPIIALAGTLFNPPHWRGQANASWSMGTATLTAVLNYSGGLDDTRFTPSEHEHGMTTFDLTGRVRLDKAPSLLRALDLTLSVQNLFNAKPGPIRTTYPFESPFDSTNFSAIGRFVSVGLRKAL